MDSVDLQNKKRELFFKNIRENLSKLEKEQKDGEIKRNSLVINRVMNNTKYINELEKIVFELEYFDSLKVTPPRHSNIKLEYSNSDRFEIILKIIQNQENESTF